MFEILSAIGLTVSAAIVIGVLACAMAGTPRGRLTVAGLLGAWFALVLLIGAGGALDPVRGFGVPALGLAVAAPAAALVGAFFAVPSVRNALLGAPLPALLAVNAIRILGVIFLALYAAGQLPAPFAPSAGWGDIFIGVTAAPLAWAVTRFGAGVRPLVFVWSAIGITDLVSAIALGALSAPGPLQVFAGPPTSAIMTTLPWLIVPGFLVPSLMFIHVVIVYRLIAKPEASKAAQERGWRSVHRAKAA